MKNTHRKIFVTPLIAIFTFFTPIYTSHAKEKLSAYPQDWMSKIDSSRPISKINIPGTHVSGSFTLENPVKLVWTKTQHLNYTEKMNQGVRFFDIRGRATSNQSIDIHHDLIYLHHQLGEFLEDAHQFLQRRQGKSYIS
ncbi:hypothetical protein MTQ93_11185 [Staphylococcus agnetis]|uniref:phosphatidylinositol-specific phospholipase C domain-containing protein n=1 Tax=Staphylococcus agnetis TaxID=985762 RepID=UPI00208EC997|nr:phosphatidylinositol-specific phospholipase C domain-containing protein [Staphylococcus agnetis]MCO4346605.1 hypothetical protein [Staphylococcus agnetis]